MEIGVTDNPEDVGFYSGLVESVFAAVQLFTSRTDSTSRYNRLMAYLFSHARKRYFRQVGKEARFTLRNDWSCGGDGTIRYEYEVLDDDCYKMHRRWYWWCQYVSRSCLPRW